jgi:CO/xanthine dehydrogenase FAD-binding subunit
MPIEPPVTSPRDLAAAYAALAASPADAPARPLAGGTDLMVALTGELGAPPASLVDLWAIDALRGIAIDRGALALGALTTYTDIRRSALCREHVPALVEAAATIGAAQIQNRGTLGGNAANASPAGDTLPVLLAADAVFVVGSERGEREVPAAAFWPAYRRTALARDELIVRVRIPLVADREMRFRKVGTRRAQAISKVCVAAAIRMDGPLVADVRIALGSVAPTVIRAYGAEDALRGRALDAAAVAAAEHALDAEISPIDDLRSTAAYRRRVARNLLREFLDDR